MRAICSWLLNIRAKIGDGVRKLGLLIIPRRYRFLYVTKGIKALKCLDVDQEFYSPGAPYTWVSFGQCPYTKECTSNQCFFKRRDCCGYQPWATAYKNQDVVDNEKRMTDRYGKVVFPEFDMGVGTNCIRIVCKSAKGYRDIDYRGREVTR